MSEAATKVPVTTEKQASVPATAGTWAPFDTLRREIDRVFESFGMGGWQPFAQPVAGFEFAWPRDVAGGLVPALEITQKDGAYEVTAELPGLDEKDIELKLSNGVLTIKGEKKDQKEERTQDYVMSERRYGSFMRTLRVPEGVDTDKIEAAFKNGVLSVKLPAKAGVQNKDKKIEVKAA